MTKRRSWIKCFTTVGNNPVLCGYLCSWLLRGRGGANAGAKWSVILKLLIHCSIIQSVRYLFCLTCVLFHLLTGRFQFGQMSLIPPLPSILVNQSTQEMIMTHCLSNTIAPEASDVTCLSVSDWEFTFSTVLSACVPVTPKCSGLHLRTSFGFCLSKHESSVWVFTSNRYLFSCRFVCCVMVAIPLAATLFTAIIRWQQKREVSPTVESSCLNSGLNLYGTMKTNGSLSGEINSSRSEENSKYVH